MFQYDAWQCGIATIIVSAVYAVLFVATWHLALRFHPRFRGVSTAHDPQLPDLPEFTEGDRADFCSRVLSTVHCIIILPIIVVESTRYRWNWDLTLADPDGSLAPLQIALCVSSGYFLADLAVTVAFRFALWQVFALHHIFALTAICTNVLNDDCRFGSTLLIGLFMLVEVTTIPLNIQTVAEQAGYNPHSPLVTISFYTTVIVWIPSRIVVPIAMDVLMIQRIAAPLGYDRVKCFIPGIISAFLITLFCLGVFAGVLVPAVIARWRPPSGYSAAGSVAAAVEAIESGAEELMQHIPPG